MQWTDILPRYGKEDYELTKAQVRRYKTRAKKLEYIRENYGTNPRNSTLDMSYQDIDRKYRGKMSRAGISPDIAKRYGYKNPNLLSKSTLNAARTRSRKLEFAKRAYPEIKVSNRDLNLPWEKFKSKLASQGGVGVELTFSTYFYIGADPINDVYGILDYSGHSPEWLREKISDHIETAKDRDGSDSKTANWALDILSRTASEARQTSTAYFLAKVNKRTARNIMNSSGSGYIEVWNTNRWSEIDFLSAVYNVLSQAGDDMIEQHLFVFKDYLNDNGVDWLRGVRW